LSERLQACRLTAEVCRLTPQACGRRFKLQASRLKLGLRGQSEGIERIGAFPTATAFGIHDEQFDLYITNAAFPFFSDTHQPSLIRLHLDVPGAPLNH
jgi:hypothetical protein